MPQSTPHAKTPIMLTPSFGLSLDIVHAQVANLDSIASIMGSILSTGRLLCEESQRDCRHWITTTLAHRDALLESLKVQRCDDPTMLLLAIDEARITLDPAPTPMTEREEFELMVSQDIRMRHALDKLSAFQSSAQVHPDYIKWQIGLRQFLCRHIKATKHFVQAYL